MDVTVCRGPASHLHSSALHSRHLRPAGVAGQPACSCRDVRVQASACARHHKPYFFFVLLDGMLSEMPPHELPTPEPAELGSRCRVPPLPKLLPAPELPAPELPPLPDSPPPTPPPSEPPPSCRRAAAEEPPPSRRRPSRR